MDTNQVFWPNYLFFADFTDDADLLKDLPVGVVDQQTATALAAALSTYDKGEYRSKWADTDAVEFGLLGAEITYNGENLTSMATNGAFNHALVVKFPDGHTPNGFISLNYNSGEGTAPANVVAPTDPDA